MTTTKLIHFATNAGNTMSCACGDWSHATNWTTVQNAVTCPECIARIRTQPSESARIEEGPWFGNKD